MANACNTISEILNALFLILGATVAGLSATQIWGSSISELDFLKAVVPEFSGSLFTVVFILGCVISLVGIFGLISSCCGRKEGGECCAKFFKCPFLIIMIVITIVLLVLSTLLTVLVYAPGVVGADSNSSTCPGAVSIWTGTSGGVNSTQYSPPDSSTQGSVDDSCFLDKLAYIALTQDVTNTGVWAQFQDYGNCCGYYCGADGTCIQNAAFGWEATGSSCDTTTPVDNCRSTTLNALLAYATPVMVACWSTFGIALILIVSTVIASKSYDSNHFTDY